MFTPHVSNLIKFVNPTPKLTQVDAPKGHLEVLISQMDLTINSRLAGRLAQYISNWQKITQDRWVLQAISGYHLELTRVPWQSKPMPEITCSLEEQGKISEEIKELLSKGAIVEATISKESFVSQIFLVEKKEGGQSPVINLKSLNNFVKTAHFKMKGLHILPDLIQQDNNDKVGFERCLPSGTNPPGMPSPPSVPMEQSNLPVSVPPLWVDISPTCVFKNDETCSGDPEAHGHLSHHIPGRHLDLTPGNGGAYPAHSTDLPVSQGSRFSSQPEELTVNPTAKNGIFEVSDRYKNSASDISSRETLENSTTSPASPSPTDCLSERPGKICGKNFSIPEGDMASPTALQGITVSDPLCNSQGPLPQSDYTVMKFNANLQLTREAESNLRW